jgi:hypothetical protein
MYSIKTLADCQQSLADRLTSGKLPTSSVILTFWTRNLNRGKDYCARKLRISTPRSITTTSGKVACGAYFLLVNTVFGSDNKEITQIAEQDSPSAEGNVFWISGNQKDGFYFNVPTGNDDTFTINQAEQFDDMVLGTDKCIIPDEEAIVSYAYSFIRKSQTDPIGDADSALQECDNRLNELLSVKTINDSFDGMTLEQL